MMVSPLEVVEQIAKNMDEDEEEKDDDEPITPYQEIEVTLQRVPDVPSYEVAVEKTALLVDVLRRYLTPCLMATPLVYLSDDSWEFYDHKAFRAARRKELVDIAESLKSNLLLDDVASSSVVDTIKGAFGRQSTDRMPTLLPSIVDGLENVFLEVLKVRLPAMPSIYLTENFFDTVPVKEAYKEIIDKLQKNRKMDIRTRVYGLEQIFVQFLLLCPIGRPQLYVNDNEWKLVSEKDLRADLRRMIFQRNANVASP